jgi:transposase
MARPSNYSPELRAQAVRMVAELTPDCPSQYAAITAVAKNLFLHPGVACKITIRESGTGRAEEPGCLGTRSRWRG